MVKGARKSRRKTAKRAGAKENQAPQIVVVTEGKVTEPRYLRAFGRYFRQPVRIIKASGSPEKIVDRALEEKSNLDLQHDTIWVMFDRDDHPQFEQAIKDAQQKGIKIAVSNPCFELWCLLHHQDQDAHIERAECRRLLESYGTYNRRKKSFEGSVIAEKWSDAEQRARTILLNRQREGNPFGNPSCTVHHLTKRIRDVAAESKGG